MSATAISERGLRLAWGLTVMFTLAIGVATLTPVERPPLVPSDDKVQHFLAFLILSVPLARAYPKQAIWVALAAIVYGGAIEIVQPYVNRGRELGDFVADAAGALCGAGLGHLWARFAMGRRA